MMRTPELSILIPTYNRAKMLERCLTSVLTQNLAKMEVLVSDNASTDKTQDVLRKFSDDRLRAWRNPENIGGPANIWEVIRQARGKWCMYLTDDDHLLPGAIDRLLEILRANDDVGVMMSTLKITHENGTSLPNYRFCERQGRFEPGFDALIHLVRASHVISRVVCRREWADIPGMARHVDSLYPQMHLVGSILKTHPGYYLDECLVDHTAGNKVFWEYTSDFMVRPRLRILEDLFPGNEWQRERKALTDELVDEICRDHFPITWKQKRWCAHQCVVRRIPGIWQSVRYWRGMAMFFTGGIYGRVRSVIRRS